MVFQQETVGYQLPSAYSSLKQAHIRWTNLAVGKKPGAIYEDLVPLAEDLGLKNIGTIPHQRGIWDLYHKNNYPIPNFPAGETTVSTALALYKMPDFEGSENLWARQAIARVAAEPISEEQFIVAIRAWSDHYVENKEFAGYWLTNLKVCFLGTLETPIVGGLAGTALASYVSPEAVLVGTSAGLFAGLGLSIGSGILSEKTFKKQVPDRNHYFSAGDATKVLQQQTGRIRDVQIQKELYQALKDEGLAYSPHALLNIYTSLPEGIIEERKREIYKEKHPDAYPSRPVKNTFPTMLKLAKDLAEWQVITPID